MNKSIRSSHARIKDDARRGKLAADGVPQPCVVASMGKDDTAAAAAPTPAIVPLRLPLPLLLPLLLLLLPEPQAGGGEEGFRVASRRASASELQRARRHASPAARKKRGWSA